MWLVSLEETLDLGQGCDGDLFELETSFGKDRAKGTISLQNYPGIWVQRTQRSKIGFWEDHRGRAVVLED
ncbi:hypothetical protein ColLi_13759 [Colletotrichum liriopes]|uniref:Uncharacterized protein n=1 Tax=Colletotrichum liriopes TaxID=708192 RepID=A0AA37H2W4_9PEZI|nr:hypothetical protein ColLi_13759 [Colletotrichum liriopes]